ncbi:MAG: WS/DGAT domain-containing protein, partial [Actinomycetota bacterium]|nr:WS/DGAT domain-containing protein [Actinomycetota bacterium]
SAGAPATLVALGARLAANARPFNMTVTNVPGPQFPLYLLDARVEATYPLVPLWESHGIGIAMFSYDGTVSWGINADYGIMPDVDRFGQAIMYSFAELCDAASNAPESPERPAKAKKADKAGPKKRPPIGT